MLDGVHVGARCDGSDRADHAGPAALRRFDEGDRPGGDDVDDRHVELIAQGVDSGCGSGVAGDHDGLHVVIDDEAGGQLPSEAAYLIGRARSIRVAGRIPDVHKVLGRQQVDDGAGNSQPSETGVEHPDRPIHDQQARSRAIQRQWRPRNASTAHRVPTSACT